MARTKKELLYIMKEFVKNKHRGISIPLFCKHAGFDYKHFYNVFIYETQPLTENMQKKCNKAFDDVVQGNLKVMQNRDLTLYTTYRKEPKPHFVKTNKVVFKDGKITLEFGIKNSNDYSTQPLDFQLKKG